MVKWMLSLLFVGLFSIPSQSQKVIGDCTVVYAISITGMQNPNNGLKNAVKTFYIKGLQTRVDIASPAFNQSIIYDGNTGTAVILKEVGADKYISTYDAAKWKEANKKYEDISLSFTDQTKTILGFKCKNAVARLKNGTSFSIFYATDIIPSLSENPFQFKNIPGFVLEYEAQQGTDNKQKIIYTATRINFSPVPFAKFEIPKSGYRRL